jgi:hypothetical protein
MGLISNGIYASKIDYTRKFKRMRVALAPAWLEMRQVILPNYKQERHLKIIDFREEPHGLQSTEHHPSTIIHRHAMSVCNICITAMIT